VTGGSGATGALHVSPRSADVCQYSACCPLPSPGTVDACQTELDHQGESIMVSRRLPSPRLLPAALARHLERPARCHISKRNGHCVTCAADGKAACWYGA